MRGRGHALRAVDGHAHVAAVLQQRLAGVQAHPDARLNPLGPVVLRERLLRGDRPRHGVGGGPENDEERVALRVDLDAPVLREDGPKEAVVRGEHLAVALTPERRQEARGALHVREQERDGPGRQLGHASILRHGAAAYKTLGRAAPVRSRR